MYGYKLSKAPSQRIKADFVKKMYGYNIKWHYAESCL